MALVLELAELGISVLIHGQSVRSAAAIVALRLVALGLVALLLELAELGMLALFHGQSVRSAAAIVTLKRVPLPDPRKKKRTSTQPMINNS